MLNLSHRQVRRLIQTGQLESALVGGRCRRITEAAVHRYVDSCFRPTPPRRGRHDRHGANAYPVGGRLWDPADRAPKVVP